MIPDIYDSKDSNENNKSFFFNSRNYYELSSLLIYLIINCINILNITKKKHGINICIINNSFSKLKLFIY